MATNTFLYLVQGEEKLVKPFLHLATRPKASALFLTYDKQLDGALFLPNSTWAEGRNLLFEKSKHLPAFEYYIFCDDDILFKTGGWDLLEQQISLYKPGIAVPIFTPKTVKQSVRWLPIHSFSVNDEQLMVIHRDIFYENIIFPYFTHMDHISWWASCLIQEILIQTFYKKHLIQFNRIHVLNEGPTRYTNTSEQKTRYKHYVYGWLRTQFKMPHKDVITKKSRIPVEEIFFCLTYRLFSRKKKNYKVKKKNIPKMLKQDSVIYERIHSQKKHLDDNPGKTE